VILGPENNKLFTAGRTTDTYSCNQSKTSLVLNP